MALDTLVLHAGRGRKQVERAAKLDWVAHSVVEHFYFGIYGGYSGRLNSYSMI